jgi:CRP-like cAMP-binding protein
MDDYIRFVIDALGRVDAFRGIPEAGLQNLLAWGHMQIYPIGGILMRQGEPGDRLHVVLRGQVRVMRESAEPEPLVLAVLGPGEMVGEMGVLDRAPRSATVIATQETQTLELGADLLAQTILLYPEVTMPLLRTLSQRLRNTSDLVEHMARSNL